MNYLFAAFCFIWIVLFGYLRFLQKRLKALQQEISLLKEAIRKSLPDEGGR